MSVSNELHSNVMSHMLQDVRLPMAGLGIIIERYCEDFDIPQDAYVLPHLHYILSGYVYLMLYAKNDIFFKKNTVKHRDCKLQILLLT
jgi:hypothetical protein